MLREALERVMALQPSYTAANSEQMRERGNLVRHVIPDALREAQSEIAAIFVGDEDQLLFFGSDGVGQKTPYCWVRIASRNRSPNPQTGWYVVYLFDAPGGGVYLSLNQGTTTWDGTSFTPLDPQVLQQRVAWGGETILKREIGAPRLLRQIELGRTREGVRTRLRARQRGRFSVRGG